MGPRVRILPDHGRLLISTDLHGNREDFERLRARFWAEREAAEDPTTIHWALLGDLVHGPSEGARAIRLAWATPTRARGWSRR